MISFFCLFMSFDVRHFPCGGQLVALWGYSASFMQGQRRGGAYQTAIDTLRA